MNHPVSDKSHALLRHRDGQHARVTAVELFFDLVYAFAVTQLSHKLLGHLDAQGIAETLVLWFAVWLGWQYTCWVTNWFDPETPAIRALVFAVTLLGLVMAAALPGAFGERALLFVVAYVAIQVGRTAFIVSRLPADHPLAPNYRRMLGWLVIAAAFWLAGAFIVPQWRMQLWLVAIACEYVSPMFGFPLPGLGRSSTRDWTIEGGHLAERCQAFVIVALGEALVSTGASLSDAQDWDGAVLLALLAAFFTTVAMWWLYFGTSSEDATHTIERSDDPGRIGAYFHYVHAILIAGIIVCAVGNDLVLAHPGEAPPWAHAVTLVAGPVIYLIGSAIYKKVVYGRIPRSHLLGAILLLALLAAVPALDMLAMAWMTCTILLGLGLWEGRQLLRRRTVTSH
ncbi:low temperature requirement protein A [Labrys neptuniae]